MRSNLDGEYYVKYKESSQHMVPLAKFLQEYGITAQYTMSDRLEQNGVAKIRNCTLKYMVRSLTNLNLLISSWGEDQLQLYDQNIYTKISKQHNLLIFLYSKIYGQKYDQLQKT